MVIKKNEPCWLCSDTSVHNNERNAYGHEALSTLETLSNRSWDYWSEEDVAKAVQVLQDFQRVVLELPAPAAPAMPEEYRLTEDELQVRQRIRERYSVG